MKSISCIKINKISSYILISLLLVSFGFTHLASSDCANERTDTNWQNGISYGYNSKSGYSGYSGYGYNDKASYGSRDYGFNDAKIGSITNGAVNIAKNILNIGGQLQGGLKDNRDPNIRDGSIKSGRGTYRLIR